MREKKSNGDENKKEKREPIGRSDLYISWGTAIFNLTSTKFGEMRAEAAG